MVRKLHPFHIFTTLNFYKNKKIRGYLSEIFFWKLVVDFFIFDFTNLQFVIYVS